MGSPAARLSLFERELLRVDFTPIKGSKTGELAANFEIVLGRTPDERSFRPKVSRYQVG